MQAAMAHISTIALRHTTWGRVPLRAQLASRSSASVVGFANISVRGQRRGFSATLYDEAGCVEKPPEQSALAVRFPFAASAQLRREYARFDGNVRLGKLLEDFDSASGDIAERHTYHGNGADYRCDNVTACVDGIEVLELPYIGRGAEGEDSSQTTDVVLEGRIIWTGRSSMLIRMNLFGIDPSWKADPKICGPAEPDDSDDSVPKQPRVECARNAGKSMKRIYRIADLASDVPDLDEKVGVLWRMGRQHTGKGTEGAVDAILPPEDERRLLLKADFLFVGLQPSTRKAVKINPLKVDPNNANAVALFAHGEREKDQRKKQTAIALTRTPPQPHEAEYLHKLHLIAQESGLHMRGTARDVDMFDYATMLTGGGSGSKSDRSAMQKMLAPTGPLNKSLGGSFAGTEERQVIPIASTVLKTYLMTHPQEQNSGGKIFGGQLMRQAFEIAFQCIALFHASSTRKADDLCSDNLRSQVLPVFIDDIVFFKPVAIGSSIRFSSRIVYTSDVYAQVLVDAEIYDFSTRQKYTSNQFALTFKRVDGEPFPHVLPQTYADMMLSLTGRRVLKRYVHEVLGKCP